MGVFVLTDATIIVNGVTLSDHGNQVQVQDTREQVDVTGFGSSNKVYGKGLGDCKIAFTLFQDFAASKTHATLQPLIGSTTGVTVEVRATSAARSATNPAALMTGLLFEYDFLNGNLNDASSTPVEFVNASGTGMTYPTS